MASRAGTTVGRPGVDLPDVTTYLYGGSSGLPLFIEPAGERVTSLEGTLAWFGDHREQLDTLVTEIGAVVLRGFPIDTTPAFGALVEGYDSDEHGYVVGAAPRAQVEGRVFEATKAPAPLRIGLHQEMAYLPHFPAKLAFYCLRPSETGGETIIGDMRRFTDLVPPRFRDAVKERGVQYRRNFRSPDWSSGDANLDLMHKPWPDAFGTADPRAAEAACLNMGLQYEWVDGSLTVLYNAPGFLEHPVTGQEVWFNQIATMSNSVEYNGAERLALTQRLYGDRPWPLDTRFGDGAPIPPSDVSSLYPALDEVTVAFPWQHGDVMLLDNLNTAHGRNPFTGERDVQVSLLY
ncbi:TauD/TfdA family dioxygenase [Blastococcus sp. URHD0036]|uniref:TauD/TfdA family dioxygenase n=1 Tax=Blastococcus sp. URHD0036 TaxID=1380356 RepID=UPI00068DEB34|nr:TauD/TfdA family dioxygenase [Blastococcus sp. URHD0036]